MLPSLKQLQYCPVLLLLLNPGKYPFLVPLHDPLIHLEKKVLTFYKYLLHESQIQIQKVYNGWFFFSLFITASLGTLKI